MWSTSPAETILSVPPFVAQDVGVGGGVVEMFDGVELPPLAWLGDDDPQPAATKTRPSSTAAPAPNPSRPGLAPGILIMVSPFVERGAWLFSAGVERVADAVSEEVEGEHGEDERRPREGEVPPGGVEDRGGLGDHLAPARLGRVDADAEVGEGRLQQDVLRDDERRVDDDRRDEVGEDLAEEDRPVAGAARARRLQELLLAQREHLAADDAADVRPVDDDDRHDHRGEAGLDESGGAPASEGAGGGD